MQNHEDGTTPADAARMLAELHELIHTVLNSDEICDGTKYHFLETLQMTGAEIDAHHTARKKGQPNV